MPVWKQYLSVALGSTIGGVMRFWIGGMVAARMGTVFPWNTLVINITGSFLIGILGAMSESDGVLPVTRTLIQTLFMTGVCGGYTTFSSFSLQTLKLMRDREWLYAMGNILGSVVFCMIGVWLGVILGKKLMHGTTP